MLQDTDYYQIEELAKRIEDAVAALPEVIGSFLAMHRFRKTQLQGDCRNTGAFPKQVHSPYSTSVKATARGFERLPPVTTTSLYFPRETKHISRPRIIPFGYYLSAKVLIDNLRCIKDKLMFLLKGKVPFDLKQTYKQKFQLYKCNLHF